MRPQRLALDANLSYRDKLVSSHTNELLVASLALLLSIASFLFIVCHLFSSKRIKRHKLIISSPLYTTSYVLERRELACLVSHYLTTCMLSSLGRQRRSNTIATVARYICMRMAWGSAGVSHHLLVPYFPSLRRRTTTRFCCISYACSPAS